LSNIGLKYPEFKMSALFSRQVVNLFGQNNPLFFQTINGLPGCINQAKFRCFNWSNQLRFPEQKKKDDANASFKKRDITFVTKLRETRARLNVSQKEVGKIVGASAHTLSDFETFTMSPANWRKWQERINTWVKKPIVPSQNERVKTPNVQVFASMNKHRVTLKDNFNKDQHPSSEMITLMAKEIGLEETSVYNWFQQQRTTKTWVCVKLEDPKYKKNVNKSVKEALEFINKFEKTRKDLGHSQKDVARSQYWPHAISTLNRFESLRVSEDQLVRYHQILKGWMTNQPQPKERGRKLFLIEKHRDHLNQVFKSGEENPSQAKLKEIADKTGISVKSLHKWFENQRRLKTYRENKQ